MHEELSTNQDVMAAIWNKDGVIAHVNEVQDHRAVRYFEKIVHCCKAHWVTKSSQLSKKIKQDDFEVTLKLLRKATTLNWKY
jgi:uncharacterized metal-binding protein